MIRANELRGYLIVAVAGLLAPFVLAELILQFAIHVWFPTSKYLWFSHGIATGRLPINVPAVLDSTVSGILGLVIAVVVGWLSRNKPLVQWIIFAVCFFVPDAVYTVVDGNVELLLFYLGLPHIPVFLGFAALGFWLASRSWKLRHVA